MCVQHSVPQMLLKRTLDDIFAHCSLRSSIKSQHLGHHKVFLKKGAVLWSHLSQKRGLILERHLRVILKLCRR